MPAIIDNIAKGIAGIATFIDSVTPKLEDEVVVEVLGEPGASKRTLYFLALSTAYGLARPNALARFFTPPPSLLMLEYDAADHWVRVTVKYKVGALDFVNQGLGNGFAGAVSGTFLGPVGGAITGIISSVGTTLGPAGLLAGMPILNGPPDTVVGVTPAIPFSFLNIPFPGTLSANNPFIGASILTNDKTVVVNNQSIPTPNPKPSGDSRSRGSVEPNTAGTRSVEKYLVPLVFAALSAPGSQNDLIFTPPQQGPGGSG